MNPDDEHLRLLAIFHYVVAGLMGLFALIPVIHLIVGIMLLVAPQEFGTKGAQPLPAFIGWMFVIIASTIILIGWTFAGVIFAAGRCLAKRKRRLFCLVVAGLECCFAPFGTVLGVFTIVVLMRESIQQLFAANDPAQRATDDSARAAGI